VEPRSTIEIKKAVIPRLLCNCGIQSKGAPDTDIKVSVYI